MDSYYNSCYFSIRATSPDESLVSEWKVVTAMALDSGQHTRLDFQLSSNQTSLESYCELDSSSVKVVGSLWLVVVVVGGWYGIFTI